MIWRIQHAANNIIAVNKHYRYLMSATDTDIKQEQT